MSIKAIIHKIDDFKTAIESIEVLVQFHNLEHLKPVLINLNEQKQIAAKQLSNYKNNIEVQYQEVNRLSHI